MTFEQFAELLKDWQWLIGLVAGAATTTLGSVVEHRFTAQREKRANAREMLKQRWADQREASEAFFSAIYKRSVPPDVANLLFRCFGDPIPERADQLLRKYDRLFNKLEKFPRSEIVEMLAEVQALSAAMTHAIGRTEKELGLAPVEAMPERFAQWKDEALRSIALKNESS